MIKNITIKRTENTTPNRNWDFIAYVEEDCEDGQYLFNGLGSSINNALIDFISYAVDREDYETIEYRLS